MTATVSTDRTWFLLGKEDSLENIKQLYETMSSNTHAFVDMVLMGATDGYLESKLKEMDSRRKTITSWCLLNGACQMWCGSQRGSEYIYTNTRDTNRDISMLNGSGEVTKGSFKGISEFNK